MPDSDLKIFIVGPVGAGKTVFACMLNALVTAHSEFGVVFKAGDWNTKKHFADIHDVLAKQEWPLPTEKGKRSEIRWEWEFGRRKAFFDLVDPAGEDIERAMRGEGDELPILDSIRAADVLFVLVDLHGHQGDTAGKRAQNGWIIENVLRQAVNVRRLVIGITKGDLEHRLPAEAWTDKEKLMTLISENMRELNLAAYRSQLQSSKVQMVMFAAVATDSYLNEKGELRQRPRKPLESQGLEIFVKSITRAHDDKKWDEFIQKVRRISKRIVTSRLFLVLQVGLLVGLLALWWWRESRQTFKITFKTSQNMHAGTDDRVSLNLIGDKSESGWLDFDGSRPNHNMDPFEKGSVDVFERTVWSVGPIVQVKVKLNDSGEDGGWLLEKVAVEEELRDGSWGPKTPFPCDVWLKRSGQTEMTLHK